MKEIDNWFYERVLEIISEFDFQKVHDVMDYMNWSWAGTEDRIPSVSELQKLSLEILRESYQIEKPISTGGFTADYNSKEKFLVLRFTIEEVEAYEKD